MPFFKRSVDEAEKHDREALRLRDRTNREFNLGMAIWHLREAIQLKPNNPVYHYHLGQAYADVPLLAVIRQFDTGFGIGDSAIMAIAELKEAIMLRPNYPEAFAVLGEVYMYLGENEKAFQAFYAVTQLSESKMLLSYVKQKIHQLEHGININPDPAEARKCLEQAVIYRDRERYSQADHEMEKALRLAPDWHWLYDNLCEVG